MCLAQARACVSTSREIALMVQHHSQDEHSADESRERASHSVKDRLCPVTIDESLSAWPTTWDMGERIALSVSWATNRAVAQRRRTRSSLDTSDGKLNLT